MLITYPGKPRFSVSGIMKKVVRGKEILARLSISKVDYVQVHQQRSYVHFCLIAFVIERFPWSCKLGIPYINDQQAECLASA